jgi:hypothetical protein
MVLLLASVPAHREQRQPEGVRDVILGELDTGGWPHQPERPDPQSQETRETTTGKVSEHDPGDGRRSRQQ